jgi:hypothetical protein
MASFKSDIQATRSTASAGSSAIIAGPIRLRGIIMLLLTVVVLVQD